MAITGIGGNYTDYMTQLATGAAGTAFQEKVSSEGFADRLREASERISESAQSGRALASKKTQEDELMGVCRQFESYLLEQVFKGMEKTIMRADEDEGSATSNLVNIFKNQSIQKIAEQSTEIQGLGLAQMLYEQLQRNLGISPDSAEFQALTSGAAAAAASGEEKAED